MRLTKPTDYDRHYYLHLTDKCFVYFINDWLQFRGKYNWYTFHFCHIYLENETMSGGLEFEFVILGLGFCLRYNYAFEESKVGKIIEELQEK